MTTRPKLLNYNEKANLPRQLFADLQLDKVLSEQAINVLQKPCTEGEILRREELFALLEKSENNDKLKDCLTILINAERALTLLKDAEVQLDRYRRHMEAFAAYINACESLVSLSGCGSLLADVANYFSSEEKQRTIAEISEGKNRITTLLNQMRNGLLSFADKNWLTPDCDAVSEFDHIAVCAEELGFSVIKKRRHNTKINLSMSNAVCRLYADKVIEIEAILEKFANTDFYEPLSYISEIRFFLEIHDLIRKSGRIGVPYCIPKAAKEPLYQAKELFDISLLTKNCERIVPNDADFTENESFYFLFGANGGGKTSYLRAVGINLVLFLTGCPIFAKNATIYPFDFVASHFPKDERFDNIGRLDEELKRTVEMINASDNKTAFLLFNETFSGTDDKRGFELLKNTAEQVRAAKHFGLYVTHFYEAMSLDYPALSAEIDPADQNKRTYRIVKSKGNASSYAADILKKYRLDKESLKARRDGYVN